MGWQNKDGTINYKDCEPCQHCKKITDHKTGYCLECRHKFKMIGRERKSFQRKKQISEAGKYLK